MAKHARLLFEEPETSIDEVAGALAPFARTLGSERDLDAVIERIGDARYVLLGEATHGTHEFYAWRARLTARLIAERGFSFVAVEGDFPDSARVDAWVKGRASGTAEQVLRTFSRWPTWMWANREVARFATWLRGWNAGRPKAEHAGFFGLDVYSLWDSMNAVVRHLERVDPAAAKVARRAYECFAPFAEDPEQYALATRLVPASCEDEVVRALAAVRRSTTLRPSATPEDDFFVEQNALVTRNAEAYYRAMVGGGASSWNVRDRHMVETLERLMGLHGPRAKAVVWEHNTHVGDARFTDMADAGEVNVGQLVRERHADDGVFVLGFSTHRGSVIAADEWGAPMERMRVPRAREGSYEDALHALAGDRRELLLIFDERAERGPLLAPRGHRAIGVVYRPDYERFGNYVPTVLPRRYDALIHVEESNALAPLHLTEQPNVDAPETYPTGM